MSTAAPKQYADIPGTRELEAKVRTLHADGVDQDAAYAQLFARYREDCSAEYQRRKLMRDLSRLFEAVYDPRPPEPPKPAPMPPAPPAPPTPTDTPLLRPWAEREAEIQAAKDALQAPDTVVQGTCMDGIETKEVSWLWPNRIPLGMLSTLDGDPGTGKTMLALTVAARVTRGEYFPDGARAEPGNAIVISLEDDLAATIKPRLIAAGADLKRVFSLATVNDVDITTMKQVEAPFILPKHIPLLQRAITQRQARLVIIDPLMGCLDSSVDAHKDQSVRTLVTTPLKQVAEETGCAILLIRHLSKTGDKDNAIYRGGGSIGWIGAARAGLMAIRDPDDEQRCVLAMAKCNLAEMPPSWSYRVVEQEYEPGKRVGAIAWVGKSEQTAASLMQAQRAKDREQHGISDRMKQVLDVVRRRKPALVSVAQVAQATGMDDNTTGRYLNRLAEYGHIEKAGRGKFHIPPTEDAGDMPL